MLEKVFGEINELVEIALTHPSYTKENNLDSLLNYERLEFFGDSVLKLYTSKLLFEMYPKYAEGKLSKIRSILVSDAMLSKVAIKIGVDKLLKLGPSEERQGGRKRESNIACAMEAILGAYYLNKQEAKIESFIKDFLMPYSNDIDKHFEKYNAKEILQQYTQGVNKKLPIYRTISKSGPAHKPTFEVEVSWNDRVLAIAKGNSKKEAEQECAFEACKSLNIIAE